MTEDKRVRENLSLYHENVEMPGGWEFNLPETLRQVDMYYVGKFLQGDTDENGLKRYFYNITKPACDIASKFIDLDTKHILLFGKPGTSANSFKIWVMQRDLWEWMKENKFGKLINQMKNLLPKYGHVVLKNDGEDNWSNVNIHNLRMNPRAASLEESHFVYEVHTMSVREVRDMPWDEQAVQEVLDRHKHDHEIRVYECYDRNEGEGKKWKRTMRADMLMKRSARGVVETSETGINSSQEFLPGTVLREDELDELSYMEHKFEEIPGRWLGMGWTEYLFDNQIRVNEVANNKVRNMQLSSLQLFKTNDEAIGRNVLTDLDNGDIIQTAGDITQIDTRARGSVEYSAEEARWDLNTERKTFSFDITRGESLPSGTPLGVARLSANMVETFYGGKREELGLFIKELLVDKVIPTFRKQRSRKHALKFFSSDEDIEKLRKAIVGYKLRKASLEYASRTGILPSPMALSMERFRLETQAKRKKDIDLEIPDGFYRDALVSVDITVTGEEMDIGSRMQSLSVALQTIASNPALLENKPARIAFFKMLELAGISAVDLDLMQEAVDEEARGVVQLDQGQPQPQGAGRVRLPEEPTSPVQPVAGESAVAT